MKKRLLGIILLAITAASVKAEEGQKRSTIDDVTESVLKSLFASGKPFLNVSLFLPQG